MNFLDFIETPTRQLKAMVEHYHLVLPQNEFLLLISDIRKVYEKFFVTLSEYSPGANRAKAGHRLLTPLIADGIEKVKPSCKKGCGACCHLEVEITRDEGELLADFVNAGFELDLERLTLQAFRESKGSDWVKKVTGNNRCVFLGAEQECLVYDLRPSTCRKLVVTNDPKECMTEEGKVVPILIPFAEIALSAIVSQSQNAHASLSKNLLAALKRSESASFGENPSGETAVFIPVESPSHECIPTV